MSLKTLIKGSYSQITELLLIADTDNIDLVGRYICPVCRAPRSIELRDHLPVATHMKILSTISLICGFAYLFRGGLLAFKLAFLYLPIWAISEFFHWSKQRRETQCPQCLFDPILYTQNWREAREKVETRLNQIKKDALAAQEAKKERFLTSHLPAKKVIEEHKTPKTPTTRPMTPSDIEAHLPKP